MDRTGAHLLLFLGVAGRDATIGRLAFFGPRSGGKRASSSRPAADSSRGPLSRAVGALREAAGRAADDPARVTDERGRAPTHSAPEVDRGRGTLRGRGCRWSLGRMRQARSAGRLVIAQPKSLFTSVAGRQGPRSCERNQIWADLPLPNEVGRRFAAGRWLADGARRRSRRTTSQIIPSANVPPARSILGSSRVMSCGTEPYGGRATACRPGPIRVG